MFIRLKNGIILRKRNCEFKQKIDTIAKIKNGDVFNLDEKSFAFLKNLNGLQTIEDIIKVYKNIYKATLKEKDLFKNRNLSQLIEYGMEPINKNQIVEVDNLQAACRIAIWHFTNMCNLTCKHCYYNYSKQDKKSFKKNEIDKIVDNLHDLGVESVVLSGGEPSLLPDDLEYVCTKLNEKCLFFTINTNAYKDINTIIKIFKNNSYAEKVQISLDGDEHIHEAIRGVSGSFKRTIFNVKKIIKAGIRVKVVSMITNGWRNKEREIFELINNLGINEWLIEIPTPTGNWQKNYQKYGLEENQLLEIVKNFIKIRVLSRRF